LHSLWWIKDAPNLDTPEGIKEAPKFIDKYISTEIPTEDEIMCKRVSALQRHNHTNSLCFSLLFVQTKVEEIQSGNSICF
jgi:hypothetical protein